MKALQRWLSQSVWQISKKTPSKSPLLCKGLLIDVYRLCRLYRARPTVCFLARWDPQKRVERFLELAYEFPGVDFIAMGQSHDPETDARIRSQYKGVPNLSMPGFVTEEEKSRILERSWALVNTSVREALPVSFLEALAHETPLISGLDPDGLVRRFGYPTNGADYSGGLRRMLADEGRQGRGIRAKRYVAEVHELGKVVDAHIKVYEGLLKKE